MEIRKNNTIKVIIEYFRAREENWYYDFRKYQTLKLIKKLWLNLKWNLLLLIKA